MASTDTQLQQLVINVGTEAQIAAAIQGGTITSDMLSITTDGPDYQTQIPAGTSGDVVTYTGTAGTVGSTTLATVATSGAYTDLSGIPTIPTVNDATLTIQKNGTTINTFTANSSSDVTANITVPTKISDLTNDSNFANTDLSNLTSTGKNIANWSSNITNCITTISEDINLELSGGTLTLKAGSKLYMPNGAGVFDVITISTDITTTTAGSGSSDLFYFYSNGSFMARPISDCFSGTSQPTVTTSTAEWYDTTNNVIKHTGNSGSSWTTPGTSFPLCICSRSGGTITGIKQVFNGFGFIGSTIFALPGVKGLAPDYRNTDGTLKNREISTNSVVTRTFNITATTYIGFQGYSFGAVQSNTYSYDPIKNIQYSGTTPFNNSFVFAQCKFSSGVISDWVTLKETFRVLDYNDVEYIAHQAMPSNRYTDLTLSNPLALTAPADGWFNIAKTATAAGQTISIINTNTNAEISVTSSATDEVLSINIPTSKGDTFLYQQTALGTTVSAKFIYANGAK